MVEAAVAGAPHNVLHCIRPNASCTLEPPPSSCSVFRWSGLCSASHSRRFAKTAVHRWIGRFGRQGKSSANTNWVVIDATAATMTLTIIRNVLFNRAVQFWLSFVCFAINGAALVQFGYMLVQRWSCFGSVSVQVVFSLGSILVQFWFSVGLVLVQLRFNLGSLLVQFVFHRGSYLVQF